jgi:hypothetical protein
MKGNLVYTGEKPTHALKNDFVQGTNISLEALFKTFGSRCPTSNKLDDAFIGWLFTTYIEKLGSDFELVVDFAGESSDNKVTLESSEISVATTLVSAEKSLREKARTQNSVQTDIGGGMDQNTTMSDKIKNLPKPGEIVTTGEAFNAPMEMRRKDTSAAFVLDEVGRSINAVPTSKEEQRKRDNALANLSGRAHTLIPDVTNSDGTMSRVDSGRDSQQDTTIGFKEKVVSGAIRNKDFNPTPVTGSNSRVIKPEDIAHNKDLSEAVRLIDMCKDSTTIKVAKMFAQRMGNQSLVEKLDRKLRSMPRF